MSGYLQIGTGEPLGDRGALDGGSMYAVLRQASRRGMGGAGQLCVLLCAGLLLMAEGCRPADTRPPGTERLAPSEPGVSAPANAGGTAPQARPDGPVSAAAAQSARADFRNVALPDSVRLRGARVLLRAQPVGLVTAYGREDCARLVRALIEEEVARDSDAILPVLLGLFAATGGEERIDFEAYLLRFGSRSEAHLVGFLRAADPSLVLRSLDALGKMRSTAARDSIAVLLDHPNSWVRIGAAHALGEIGGPGMAEHLVAVLEDTAYAVVNAAIVGLGRLRVAAAYGPMLQLLESDNHHIRKHAAMGLGELGDPRAAAAVRLLAEGDADPGVRFMARKALAKLEAAP